MNRREAVGLLLTGVAAAGLAGCTSKDDTYRYKMTVEVETPEGIKIGFAVREVEYHANDEGWFPFGESRPSISIKGEAVAVDVTPGRTLFALLTGAGGEVDYASRIPDRAIVSAAGNGWDRTPRVVELWPTVPVTMAIKNTNPLPMLVRFRNPTDPKSVEQVEPEDLDEAFGPGVQLKRITIQVTDEPMTVGIMARLPTYGPETEFDTWYSSLKYGDPRSISLFDFKRADDKE